MLSPHESPSWGSQTNSDAADPEASVTLEKCSPHVGPRVLFVLVVAVALAFVYMMAHIFGVIFPDFVFWAMCALTLAFVGVVIGL